VKELEQSLRDLERLRRLVPYVLRGSPSRLVRDALYLLALAAYRGQQGPAAYAGERQVRYAALTQLVVNIDGIWRGCDTKKLTALARQTDLERWPNWNRVMTNLECLVGSLWDRRRFVRAVMTDMELLKVADARKRPGPAKIVQTIESWLQYANAEPALRALRVTKKVRAQAVHRVGQYLDSVNTPDLEAVVRRCLLAFGYPKRKAMSLFEFEDKREKRAAMRSDRRALSDPPRQSSRSRAKR